MQQAATRTCKPIENNYSRGMAKKAAAKVEQASSLSPKSKKNETGKMPVPQASALLDIRVVYYHCDWHASPPFLSS
jgi:hypothetical protein